MDLGAAFVAPLLFLGAAAAAGALAGFSIAKLRRARAGRREK